MLFAEYNTLFAVIAAIAVAFILLRLFVRPIKWIFRVLGNAIMGLVLLLLINLTGSLFNFSIAINPFTVIASGILGIPGVVLILFLKLIGF